jgi:hypothetical protein
MSYINRCLYCVSLVLAVFGCGLLHFREHLCYRIYISYGIRVWEISLEHISFL